MFQYYGLQIWLTPRAPTGQFSLILLLSQFINLNVRSIVKRLICNATFNNLKYPLNCKFFSMHKNWCQQILMNWCIHITIKPQFYSVCYMLQPPPPLSPDFDSKPYHENPEWPPICCGTVTLAVHHLWGHVFYCSTERVCLLLLKYRLFA